MNSRLRLPASNSTTTAIFAALVVLAAAMPVHNDTWWHLRSGLDTLRGESPFIERYSWTVPGTFYWNHSWLSQVLFATLHSLGGMALLTAACVVAVVTTWWMVWRQCRGDAIERAVLLAVALSVSTLTWSVRPQLATVLLPVVVALTAANRYLAVAATMAFWANLHGGFVLGVVVLAAGVGAAAMFDRSALPTRCVAAALGTAATLATPLGWTNWREIAASLERSRVNAIVEWQPPGLAAAYLAFWATAALFAVLLALRRRRLETPYLQVSAVAACLTFVAATGAMRNVPAFMMLVLPPLSALLFQRGPLRAVAVASAQGVPYRQAAIWGVTAVLAGWLWARPTPHMDWHPMAPAARAAIAACPPPMFNTFAQGGPIIWFVPTQPVFVDSRQDPFPVALVQQANHVEHTGEFRPVFDLHGVNCAVLPPASPAVAALLAYGWRESYRDSRWAVLERP